MSLRWQAFRFDVHLFFFRHFRSTFLRRAISLTLLVVVGVGMIGLPLAAPVPEKTGRFPCEDCPCGCATADFCWDKCCCHSDIEKLQWAKSNGVAPPAFLVARVGQPKVSLVSAPAKTCCGCCESKPTAAAKSPPSQESVDPTCDSARDDSDQAAASLRWVVLSDAAKCHGIELIWSLLSSVTTETRSPVAAVVDPPLLFLLALCNQSVVSIANCPDPPVP